MTRIMLLATVVVALSGRPASAADVFERHTSEWLEKAIEDADPLDALSLDQSVRLKSLSASISSPVIIVRTNDGNLAKAVVAWGFRRGPDKPTPVLLIERFFTYRADRPDATLAVGDNVMLFAGFQFNFDLGQVVPDEQGGDVRFTAESRIEPVAAAKLYGLNGSQIPRPKKAAEVDPADRDGVLPEDFTGVWDVSVDGRWRGEWRLKVDNRGRAGGRYTSDESKSVYELKGRTAAQPHNLKLDLQLDNAVQSFDAWLWTKDKSAIAGTSTLAGRKFGFYAIRRKEKADK